MFRRIYGQAKCRSDVMAEFDNMGKPLIKHLVLLYLFPQSRDKYHWREEVFDYCCESTRLKGSNKLLGADHIYQELWGRRKAEISTIVKKAIRSEPSQHIREDYKEGMMVATIDLYIKWLADQLSTRENLDPDDAFDKLEELGL